MIKVNVKNKIENRFKSFETDASEQFYNFAEIAVNDILFHINLVYGAIGCCDDYCGLQTRILTTNIDKVLEIINSDIIILSEITIQIPIIKNKSVNYLFFDINKINLGKDSKNQNAYICSSSNGKIKIFGSNENIESIKIIKTLYKKGNTKYWKDK
jgi:hypothetical protein